MCGGVGEDSGPEGQGRWWLTVIKKREEENV